MPKSPEDINYLRKVFPFLYLELRLTMPGIIHTVGPVYYSDPDLAPKLLASCYYKSLSLAKKFEWKTIAFPSLSTGIYGCTNCSGDTLTAQISH